MSYSLTLSLSPGVGEGRKETEKIASVTAHGGLTVCSFIDFFVHLHVLLVSRSLFFQMLLFLYLTLTGCEFQEWGRYSNDGSFLRVIFWIFDGFSGCLQDYSFYNFCFT